MTTLADILRAFGPEYIERFGERMPPEHSKVIHALINCRTEAAGTTHFQCEDCGDSHFIHRACGNRHCPNCQQQKSRQWLQDRLNSQLPGPHFLITFTVPEQLRRFIRSHPKLAYSALFKASSAAIKKLATDKKHMGGDLPGFFGVLHTWGRALEYHPHIHYVVAGGALSSHDGTWHPSRRDVYLPIKALSKIFRAKFRAEMRRAGLLERIPSVVWETDWNMNCQAGGDGSSALNYLAPYVFKVALSNQRIVNLEDRTVTFRYTPSGSRRSRTMALDVMEFIRRFLQHVLPTGFMKVRYFGFLNPNCNVDLDTLRLLITLNLDLDWPLIELQPWQPMPCPRCGGTLSLRGVHLPTRPRVSPG